MMDNYGDLSFAPAWEETPIEKYIEYKKNRADVTNHRLEQIKRIVVTTSTEADYESWNECIDWRDGMTIDDAWSFLDQLRAAGLAERTVEEYMRIVQHFLDELRKRNVVNANPVAYVCNQTDFEYEPKDKIERTVGELTDHLKTIPDPQHRAIGIVFAKTGIRPGEMVNIDFIDLNLDNPAYQSFITDHGIDMDPAIDDRPDSLYISSEPTVGREYRGDSRKAGNKRERDTILPIDEETKHSLLDWIAMRPRTDYPHPLWIGNQEHNRLNVGTISTKLTGNYAEESGFIDEASDERFTPHWFRHFFTTQLKPGRGSHPRYLEPTMIKYLRGDVDNDIMDVYTHEWGDTIRPEYEEAIYDFGIYG